MTKPPSKHSGESVADRTELVESLADIATRLDLSEIEYQVGELKIRVARQMTAMSVSLPASVDIGKPAPTLVVAPAPVVSAADHPGTVKSPMVGTVYVRPAPESQPFVDIGSTVKAGEKILLVEAMKTFNEIIAPRGGIVTAIFVQDGQPVEYGQALLVVE